MKSFLVFSLMLTSLSTFASNQKLLLDASCRVSCYTGESYVEEAVDGQAYSKTSRVFEYKYIDIIGVTREQLESKSQFAEYVQFCKKSLSEKTAYKAHDCFLVKH